MLESLVHHEVDGGKVRVAGRDTASVRAPKGVVNLQTVFEVRRYFLALWAFVY